LNQSAQEFHANYPNSDDLQPYEMLMTPKQFAVSRARGALFCHHRMEFSLSRLLKISYIKSKVTQDHSATINLAPEQASERGKKHDDATNMNAHKFYLPG
jgi:hypothetical protein